MSSLISLQLGGPATNLETWGFDRGSGSLYSCVSHAPKLACLIGLFLALSFCAQAADKATWKPIPGALLRIDDTPPKLWNLYHAGKKADPLLLQLGNRMLAIYVRNQQVYELRPAQVEQKGQDLLWSETDKPEKPLPTSEWSTRDVGFAWRIRMKLTAEGRMFDIQLPQTSDLRGIN